jgi:hypothetical protein
MAKDWQSVVGTNARVWSILTVKKLRDRHLPKATIN